MPLTQLDTHAALIVIDLQKGVLARVPEGSAAEIIDRVTQLAHSFRQRGLPVILVNVDGFAPGRSEARFTGSLLADWAQLVAELEPQPGDYRVTKRQFGAFHGTDLDEVLHRHGITQVFIAGVSTSMGVESTARQAYDQGYNVVTVMDAMTDLVAEAHRNSVERIFPRISERATTGEVLEFLNRVSPLA
jgi:nicotinamidase-related amidase